MATLAPSEGSVNALASAKPTNGASLPGEGVVVRDPGRTLNLEVVFGGITPDATVTVRVYWRSPLGIWFPHSDRDATLTADSDGQTAATWEIPVTAGYVVLRKISGAAPTSTYYAWSA